MADILENFFVMLHTQFKKPVKIVRSNNGTEFMCLKNYFEENGFYIKYLLLELCNKMDWNISTAIYLMWHVPYGSKLICRLNFGVNVS